MGNTYEFTVPEYEHGKVHTRAALDLQQYIAERKHPFQSLTAVGGKRRFRVSCGPSDITAVLDKAFDLWPALQEIDLTTTAQETCVRARLGKPRFYSVTGRP